MSKKRYRPEEIIGKLREDDIPFQTERNHAVSRLVRAAEKKGMLLDTHAKAMLEHRRRTPLSSCVYIPQSIPHGFHNSCG